ncbi:uncharacterized protein LOC111337437 isoform X1 [Stylophora pistillata]|uniref:uncharacterized protein LOC111337437 isoform X1 n=1 Tax=Stylophora pistillata TaxID=50429 RepID=UPI000C04E46A|nr:uncharacterized protein LOC111337437 isoform X1 [Stylophora pistillata]
MPRTHSCSYHKRKPCIPKCWYDEIMVIKHDGKQICLPCPVCSDEFGLTKPCGSVVTDGAIPKCELPILGKTFVDQQGVLQSCKVCSIGQKVLANCSAKSNTICGECKPGFYLNDHLKTCEECLWCCGYSDSRSIVDCIKQGMAFSEEYRGLAIEPPVSSLGLNEQFAQLQTVEKGNYEVKSLEFDEVVTLILISLCFFLVSVGISSKRIPILESNDHCPFPIEGNDCQLTGKKESSESGSEEPKLESPKQHSPGHMLFENTGVEVVTLDSKKSAHQHLPRDLVLHATSDELDFPGLLEDDEFALSPAIRFIISGSLMGPLELLIPHSANMVLSSNKWKIILKELKNNEWVVVSYVKGSGIEEFLPKNNHISFETDHFATFAVVGHCKERSLPVFKRMKVMAFCNKTRVGEDLVVRLYCFDDCEWSFEDLLRKEQKNGGKPMSSVESLDFSVIRGEDVNVGVKDIDGWKLESGHPMKISYASLKNSFSSTPGCNLVFSPTSNKKKSGFFATIVLTQASYPTLIYASTAIEGVHSEDPIQKKNQSFFLNAVNEGEQVTNVADLTDTKSGKGKEQNSGDCIIQLQA